MAHSAEIGGHVSGFARTNRTDRWWVEPFSITLLLLIFVAYSTWAAFQSSNYYVAPYTSPFYSPVLFTDTSVPGAAPVEHTWFGEWPSWWPDFIPASPSLLILAFPLAFRFTCYFFRKAYYRSFGMTPPACAVGPIPRKNYRGETFLLVFQNLHRYALYFALLFIFLHIFDVINAFFYEGQFGIGVGSVILAIDVFLLAMYAFGCHSFRHLVGGGLNCYSCSKTASVRHGVWKRVSFLNRHHMFFALSSLLWVGFTDIYVRLVSMGIITDWNTWNIVR